MHCFQLFIISDIFKNLINKRKHGRLANQIMYPNSYSINFESIAGDFPNISELSIMADLANS